MKISNAERASVLVQALPYIQKYSGKIVVIKYGGNAMINGELKSAVMHDIVLMSLIGVKVVLIHGGGGTAYPQFVKRWIAKGYAVIALDWYNQRPSVKNDNVDKKRDI